MTRKKIDSLLHQVNVAERDLEAKKILLGRAVSEFVQERDGSLREKAKRMGISVPYLADIVNGNRSISSNILEKIELLEARNV